MIGADKHALRARFNAGRLDRPAELIEAARAGIRLAVLQRCREARWHRIAAYVALRSEPGSPELLDALRAMQVQVLVPLMLPDRHLDWTEWGAPESAGRPASLGVDAIAEADAIIVPALAVARDGTRLGRGGGSYDRALARASAVPIAALLYSGELVAELPRDPWDVPVTAIVTPAGWLDLT
ncbi:MAG: 5-formyltetrahydrofolate cyclo-ligase [Actinomycetota bacterium]|nr:5-formyltetrahydrofolate cyclo-ligase [Actinomycetota bacterium]